MRKFILAAIATALAFPVPQANAIPPIVGGVLASENIDLVATIPDVNAIGAKIVDGYMYVTTTHGLRIYDVSGGLPILTGALAMPHWENEAVDTNGERLLISADGFVLGGFGNPLIVVDVTNKNAPVIEKIGYTYDGHTVTCIADCQFAWSSGNDVIDLRAGSAMVPTPVDTFGGKGYTHNWNVDAAGIAWGSNSFGGGGYAIDTNGYGTPSYGAPIGSPKYLNPDFVLGGDSRIGWHNSIRPNANLANETKLADSVRDPGELVIGAGEDLYDFFGVEGNCSSQSEVLTTWFRKVSGKYRVDEQDSWSLDDGTMSLPSAKPTAATFCSSHWLDYHEDLVAVGWYEQGTRILDVSNPSNIVQVGYFLPAESQTWAAYFNEVEDGLFGGGTYVYTMDYVRGIDVFKLDATAGVSPQVLAPHYNVSLPGFAPSDRFGWACRVPTGARIEG